MPSLSETAILPDMKEFTVIYRKPKLRKIDHREGFDTRHAAIDFMARNLNSGGLIWGVKYRGKDLSHKDLLRMVYESQNSRDAL